MEVSNYDKLPLLFIQENKNLLAPILKMLRQKGYVIFESDQIPISTSSDHLDIKVLDGIGLFRYVTHHWPKSIPVIVI